MRQSSDHKLAFCRSHKVLAMLIGEGIRLSCNEFNCLAYHLHFKSKARPWAEDSWGDAGAFASLFTINPFTMASLKSNNHTKSVTIKIP